MSGSMSSLPGKHGVSERLHTIYMANISLQHLPDLLTDLSVVIDTVNFHLKGSDFINIIAMIKVRNKLGLSRGQTKLGWARLT